MTRPVELRLPLLAALLVALLAATTFATAIARAETTEVIELQHRTAESLIPVLRPLLAEGDALTGRGATLIVRTSEENLAALRAALKRLDVPLQRLRITVRQDRRDDDTYRDNRAAVRADSTGEVDVRARVLRTERRADDLITQEIQVLAGQRAFISTGQLVPLADQHVLLLGGYPGVTGGVRYHDVTRGFYVVPQVVGQQVTLEISPHADAVSRQDGGRIDVQRAHTTVTGVLGEWIEIAGITRSRDIHTGSIVRSTASRDAQTRRILVRVDALP